MTSRTSSIVIGLAVALAAAVSHAAPKGGVITLDGDIVITGRVQRPLVTVEIARVPPKIALTELRPPFAERIERAVARDPY